MTHSAGEKVGEAATLNGAPRQLYSLGIIRVNEVDHALTDQVIRLIAEPLNRRTLVPGRAIRCDNHDHVHAILDQ